MLAAGPIFLVLLCPGQLYQVAEAGVLVGNFDDVITDHDDREKSHDVIWETLKRFRCNVIVRVQTQNVGHGDGPDFDQQIGLDLGLDRGVS